MDFSLRIPDMNKPVFLAIATAGCSKAENANNAGSNTYDASPVPEKTLSGIEESTSGNTDNAENDANEQPKDKFGMTTPAGLK
jgi:hypothetical protein